MKMIKRIKLWGTKKAMKIGMLTSGGDCQALNATMAAFAKTLFNKKKDVTLYGFEDGYKGLINCQYRVLREEDFYGIFTQGGTFLGSSRVPFKTVQKSEGSNSSKIEEMKKNYKKLNLDCLVVLGGNGSRKTSCLLSREGLNVVHIPKTIDNDIQGTDITFGFQSAIDINTKILESIKTTAASHSRVFIVELMGHKVGWLTLYSGIAGEADIIIIPEIPYDIDSIVKAINENSKKGKKYTIIALAEGALSKEEADMSKEELKKKRSEESKIYSSVAEKMEALLSQKTDKEIRVTVPGHVQRGGAPCPYDRILSSRLGAEAAMSLLDEDYGKMIAMVNGQTERFPLSLCEEKVKSVDPESSIIKEARAMGISFGDK